MALEPESPLAAPPEATSRRILDPTQMISTRTRRRTAVVAGKPLPPVDYGFSEDTLAPTRISASPRPFRRPPPASPASTTPPILTRSVSTPGTDGSIADIPRPPAHGRDPASSKHTATSVDPTPQSSAAPDSSESLTSSVPTTRKPSFSVSAAALPSGELQSEPHESAPSSIEAALHSSADLAFRASVDRFSHADWAREQRNEPVCDAAIRFILLGRPSALPSDFLDHLPSVRRPPLLEIRDLSNKGRLHVDDDGLVLLVRKPTAPPSSATTRPGGRAARLLNDEPIRIYVPMLMRPWIMQACHADASCHLGAARTLSMLERFIGGLA